MKQFTLKSLMLLLLLLMGGGSYAWGETKTYQHVFNAKPQAEKGVTLSEMKWDIDATNLNGYSSTNYAGVQIGSKKVDGSITLTSSADWNYNNATKITAVRLWLNVGGTSVTPSVTIGGKTAVSDGTKVVKNSKAGSDWKKTTKVTFTPAEDGNTGVVVINVSSVKAGYICAMEIDCEDGAPAANLTSIAVSGTPTKTTYEEGEPFNTAGLVVTGTYDDGTKKEITDGIGWVKDPEILKLETTSVDVIASVGNIVSDVYTVEGITVKEKVTLIGIEAKATPDDFWKGDKFNKNGITVTAHWSDGSESDVTEQCQFTEPDMTTAGKKTVTVTYENETCTYEIEVKTIENTKETAYTVSKAIALIDAGKDLASQVYVKGIVSKIVTPFESKYGNVSFDVSVDGSISGQQFRFYRTQKDAENKFKEDPNIEVGATVIGCGTILLYKDKKTQEEIYEFAAGNYLVDYKAPVEKVLKSIAISGEATKTTYTEGEAFDPTGLVVTATYDDESTEDVTSRVKWTFNPETLVLGTTSVEVMASIGSDVIDVYTVNGITVNEKVVLVGNSIVVAEDTKNSKWVAMSTSNKGTYFEAVDLVKVGDKYITTGKLDDILFYVNTVDGKTSIQNPADDKYVQATGAKKVSYTEKEYLWSNNGEQLAAAQTAHGTLQYNVADPRFTTYASKVGQYATIVDKSNVYEGAVIALSGTDGTHYFTTFSSDKAVEFVDATVYTVGVNENKLSLNEVKGNQVPANTGVLVQSNKTDAMYVYIESAPAIEGNLLRASVTEQTTTGADDTKEYKYYMLSYNKDNENLGFYWGENDGAAFTSKAGRAYLAVEKTNEVAAVKGFSLSDMETGISQVCGSAANNGVIYDLQGRRVERAVRGLYIMNGRKVMVK